jgi:predicted nucleotidyltransferase
LTLLKLENELSDLLGVRVDLVICESLRPAVQQRVLTDLVPV